VPTQLIELSLHQPETRRAHALLSLADQLLFLIGQNVPDSASCQAAAIRQKIERWRDALRKEEDPNALAALARKIVADCEAMLDRIRSEAASREAEFVDLVQTLRDVVDSLRGDASKFDADMARSTTAMEKAVDIEDIRELKKVLTHEIKTFKAALAERQAAEARLTDRLTSQVQTLEQNLKKVRAEASTDALTGIPNRGAFDMALGEWLARAAKERKPFTLGMIDLDDFKKVNDTHGHQVGDRVLIAAAQLLVDALEPGELVTRYGGEEFGVLMAAPSVVKAKARLTEVLRKIAPSYEYQLGAEVRSVTFTFSGGVTEWASGDTPESIVKRADEALYDAKRMGKHRIETRTRSFLRALVS
jgi:diguanylate cyclase